MQISNSITIKGLGLEDKEILPLVIQVIFVRGDPESESVALGQEQTVIGKCMDWAVQWVNDHLLTQLKQLLVCNACDVWSGLSLKRWMGSWLGFIRWRQPARQYWSWQYSYTVMEVLGGSGSNSNTPFPSPQIDRKPFFAWSTGLAFEYECPLAWLHNRLGLIWAYKTHSSFPVITELSQGGYVWETDVRRRPRRVVGDLSQSSNWVPPSTGRTKPYCFQVLNYSWLWCLQSVQNLTAFCCGSSLASWRWNTSYGLDQWPDWRKSSTLWSPVRKLTNQSWALRSGTVSSVLAKGTVDAASRFICF